MGLCLLELGGSSRLGSGQHLWNPEITGVKALGKLRVVSLREAVSIVVAVSGKFLSLPTIILTTRPLLALLRPQGQKEVFGPGRVLAQV